MAARNTYIEGIETQWLNIVRQVNQVCRRRYLRLKQQQEKPNSEKMETQMNGSTFLI